MKPVSPPSVFKKSCASSQNPSKNNNNRSLHIKRKRITQESFSENPFAFDIQKRELKNPFAKKNVDEFVSNLMKEPSSFEPNSAAWWEDGDKVPFLFLAKAFDLIKGESGRNIITRITCNVLRTVIAKTPHDLLEVIYLLANKIAPAHQGFNLGIGDALLIKALAQACGTSQEAVKTLYRHLYDSFEEVSGYFQFATALTSNDLEEINKFLEASLNASCEGLMVKSLEKEATYEPAKRSNNWLKLKKDYMDSFGDSLDLVPIAAFDGRGNRKGVYGSFLLACYDRQNDEFQSICKIGSGFSEEVLKKCCSSLQSKVISVPKVWEVRAADLTISPAHRAAVGEVHPTRGISLRFPRFVRLRVDKAPEDATSSVQYQPSEGGHFEIYGDGDIQKTFICLEDMEEPFEPLMSLDMKDLASTIANKILDMY